MFPHLTIDMYYLVVSHVLQFVVLTLDLHLTYMTIRIKVPHASEILKPTISQTSSVQSNATSELVFLDNS